MPAATKTIKPFANLNAAIDALDARDTCGDLDFIADETTAARIEEATDALRTAESVETMSDFVANLGVAVESLRGIDDAAPVAAKLARILTRCVA